MVVLHWRRRKDAGRRVRLIEDTHGRNGGVMHAVLARLRCWVRHSLIDIVAVGIWSRGSVHSCLWLPTHHGLRMRRHLPKIIRHWPSLVIGARCLVGLRVSRAIVLPIWPDAMQLQSDTSRAGPCICRRSVALYLSSPTSFTSSANIVLVLQHMDLLSKSMIIRTS